VAESPIVTLTRLLGGVVLMQGRLGHQVLGQLLVAGSNEVAIAGASLVVAASTRQRDAVGQIALRVAAPALAVRSLLQKKEDRIDRREKFLAERERRLEERVQILSRHEKELQARRGVVETMRTENVAVFDEERSRLRAESDRIAGLETELAKRARTFEDRERDLETLRSAAQPMTPVQPDAPVQPVKKGKTVRSAKPAELASRSRSRPAPPRRKTSPPKKKRK